MPSPVPTSSTSALIEILLLGLPREFVPPTENKRTVVAKMSFPAIIAIWPMTYIAVTGHRPSTVQVTELGTAHHISVSIIAERNAVNASCSAKAMLAIDTVNILIITPY